MKKIGEEQAKKQAKKAHERCKQGWQAERQQGKQRRKESNVFFFVMFTLVGTSLNYMRMPTVYQQKLKVY